MSELRLNLASGTDLRSGNGWQNWDAVQRWPSNARDCDRRWDARSDRIDLLSDTVDEIYAGYLLTHVSYRHHIPLVAEMFRVLKPGGKLVVDEVDMSLAVKRWLANPFDQDARNIVWGEVGTVHGAEFEEFDAHRSGMTRELLGKLLGEAGFTRMQRLRLHASEVWYAMSLECWKP